MEIKAYLEWFEHFNEGIYYVDRNRKIRYFNQAAERITGFDKSDVIDKHCYNNILNHMSEEGVHLCLNGCPLHHSMEENCVNESEVYLHHKLGHRVKVNVKTLPIIENDLVIGGLEIFSETNKEDSLDNSIKYYKKQAYTDPLTRLNNRMMLDEKLPKVISDALNEVQFGVIFIDIDNFKYFNDTFGHDLGDEVLKMLSNTLSQAVSNQDIVIRYGGEEFVVFTYNVNQQSLIELANKIRHLVSSSALRKEDKEHKVTISLGATLFLPHDTIETAIARADQAMYESKRNGKNQTTFK